MRHGKSFDDGEVLRMFGVPPSDGPESTETTITKTINFSESAHPHSHTPPQPTLSFPPVRFWTDPSTVLIFSIQ
jgi:hypothetical protein